MPDYDVTVIGAGNAGLSAATYLARKGIRTLLLEKHNIPGGCATSFCRGRFEFEVALHQLSGMGTTERPGPLRGILDGLGVLDQLEFVQMEDLYRVVLTGEMDVTLPADKDETVKILQKQFPSEKEGIRDYIDFVYKFFTEVIGAFYMNDPAISRGKYPLYFKYALTDTQTVLDMFIKDPRIQMALSMYWTYMGLPPRLLSFSDMAALLFSYMEFKPFHIKGGSQALSNALLNQFELHGGKSLFNTRVEKILMQKDAVAGVVTESGEEITSRYVISNASAISTYVNMLGKENTPDVLRKQMKGSTIGPSFFTIYAGFDAEPEELGINSETSFICASSDVERDFQQTKIRDVDNSSMIMSCYDVADPQFSPPGTSQAAIVTLKYAEPWLRVDPHRYADEKYRCAEILLKRAEKTYPGITSHIEEMEIATPVTHMRYLGHPGGGAYGFDQHVKDSNLFVSPKPPVKGLYCCGAWYDSGGFQPTLTSGTSSARAILKEMRSGEVV